MTSIRPTTPNMIPSDDDDISITSSSPRQRVRSSHSMIGKGNHPSSTLSPPDAMIYHAPMVDTAEEVAPVGTAGRGIWTIEGDKKVSAWQTLDDDNQDVSANLDEDAEAGEANLQEGNEEDDTRILLEKEFDDFYEDRVHKSAGPVIFVSKTMGMLPVIWTEDEAESECKSYFNLYTFIIFIGWVGLAVVSGLIMDGIDNWPGELYLSPENMTDPRRFLTAASIDTYLAATWVASLVTLLFGVFKCRSFAEVLFGLSETDAQLELTEKHYEKIKRKSLYWVVFLTCLLGLHAFAFFTMLKDADTLDPIFYLADILAHATVYVLDLQFLHFSMVLCKRYRLVNKILLHITKPWKTFRHEQPPNFVLQNILQYRFDQFFDPASDPDVIKQDMMKKDVPLQLLLKSPETESKVSKEEENTFIMQMDILRGIHSDLNTLSQEVNHLLGFQILTHLITCVVFVVMFGYFFSAALMDGQFYWPYMVLCLIPAIRIFFIGHWGQVLEFQSRQPFLTICQVSTVDGSPRLERQVQKLTIQMHHQCPTLTAAGYFTLGRNMILKTIGVAVIFTFFMVKFQHLHDLIGGPGMMTKMTTTTPAAAG